MYNKLINLIKGHILIIGSLFASLVLGACYTDKTTFVINGEISPNKFEGSTIYLFSLDNNDTIDSAVVKNGIFQFKGEIEKNTIGRIFGATSISGLQYASTLVLEAGEIYINLESDSLSGTPLNDLFYKTYTANPALASLSSQRDRCMQQYYLAENLEAQQAALAAYNVADSMLTVQLLDVSRYLFRSNSDNVLGAYALNTIVSLDGIAYDSLDYLMTHAMPAVSEYPPLCEAYTRLSHLANTSKGNLFADFEGIDYATGKKTTLSKIIDTNQITLIDFWASWCRPCRQEVEENLNRLYAKYHDKGLNIIGVDVWDKVDAHKAAVQQLEIQYPQFVDTTGIAAKLYGIMGIPTIILLDRKGVIIQRNLRGEAIETAVIEALK